MKNTFKVLIGIFVFGFILSLSVSAQTEITKEGDKTIKKENTVTVKSTDNTATPVKADCSHKTKAPCDPAHCKSSCKSKSAKKSCCPSHKKATKTEAVDPKKEE